ncbi:hypothetical protein [Prochlorococcus marinus]|uniref:Uncharacterized protein n=1 Tax=Prochlorococcus marinus (strain MIT 9211) TaxID=93059 RepID=A9BDC9_PROM4|nr:hypothetical protein [Prochlorococcus marinus]ABX09742.1 Hypothetical protein P9211_18111 [Prochlorococcus marinus str. MIT 9211]
MSKSEKTIIQSKVFEFAFNELVRSKRLTFQPLWTVDSWAKFLIWVAINCGLSGEKESLELFAEALGPNLTTRMRKIFFERILESLCVHLMADPLEEQVLAIPITGSQEITFHQVVEALKTVGLWDRIQADQTFWKEYNGIIAIPWKS